MDTVAGHKTCAVQDFSIFPVWGPEDNLLDLTFSQWCRKLKFSGMWHCVVRYVISSFAKDLSGLLELQAEMILSSMGNYMPKNVASHPRSLESAGFAVDCRVMT
jgi:hypothetical protein